MSTAERRRKRGEPSDPGREANHILRLLPAVEYDVLAGDLEVVPLDYKETLYEQGNRINHVYFPTSGVVSLVTLLKDHEPVETATVGREGMVGLPSFLEARRAPGRALCQVPGAALRMANDRFLASVKQVESLRTMLLQYTNVMLAVTAQAAACNRAHDVKARMARWLLTTLDRVDEDEFPLTQEFLGQMLGVRRPAVSLAGTALQRDGLIKYTRGKITVLDRKGLERAACECYAYVRNEFARQLGETFSEP